MEDHLGAGARRKTWKLNGAGQTLVIQRILCGDSNTQIRARLKATGLLDADDSLTDRAICYYRCQPHCRVECEHLSQAAREAAYAELSDNIVNLVTLARLARQRLVDHAGQLSVTEISDLARVQFKALRLVCHVIAVDGAVALCDAGPQETPPGTKSEAIRKWKRAARDGRAAMAQVGL